MTRPKSLVILLFGLDVAGDQWPRSATFDLPVLGPDLQFIRINGTVVGGLAGLAIHSLAQVLG